MMLIVLTKRKQIYNSYFGYVTFLINIAYFMRMDSNCMYVDSVQMSH